MASFVTGYDAVVGSGTVSNTPQTGALLVTGGLGVSGSICAGGSLYPAAIVITGTGISSSYTTGSLVTSGGIGIAGSLYANTDVVANGNLKSQGTANTLAVTGSSTTNPTTITASGSDTNVSIKLLPKGAGIVTFPSTFFQCYQSSGSPQSISASTTTTVKFPSSDVAPNSTYWTVSGTGNTTFTNTSGASFIVSVSYSIRGAGNTASLNTWLTKTGSGSTESPSSRFYAQNLLSTDGSGTNECATNGTCVINLNNNEGFYLNIWSPSAITVGSNSAPCYCTLLSAKILV